MLVLPPDSQVGVLRIWNVSRSTSLDNFKLKKTGFHALHVLNSPPAKKSKNCLTQGSHRGHTGVTHGSDCQTYLSINIAQSVDEQV